MRKPEQFFENVERITETGCWLWMAGLDKNEYGMLRWGDKTTKAHRLSWTFRFGDPGALHVLHRCDVPCCVNPDHMFLGEHIDNMADMKAKNRARGAPGTKNVKAKFTAEQVQAIRDLISQGFSCNSIAKSLGVVHSTITRIKRGEGWK